MFALCSGTEIFLFDLFFHTSSIFRVAGSVFIPASALFQPFFHLSPSPHLKKRAAWHILARRHLSFFISTPTTTKKENLQIEFSEQVNLETCGCISITDAIVGGMYCHRLLGDAQPGTLR